MLFYFQSLHAILPEVEFQNSVQILAQNELGHLVEEWFIETMQQDIRQKVINRSIICNSLKIVPCHIKPNIAGPEVMTFKNASVHQKIKHWTDMSCKMYCHFWAFYDSFFLQHIIT